MPWPPLWVVRITKLHKKVSKIEAWPPVCKLGVRFDNTKGMCCAFLLGFGRKIGLNLSEDLFFCSSPNFGPEIALNLSEDLFFIFCSSPNFGPNIGLNLSGTISDSGLCFSPIF